MKCAIMQPHYFPWAGYFNLISKVDKFVFLDDAQFSKDSWHSKNFIIVNKEKFSLKVPTKKSPLSTKIKDKVINQNNNWKVKQAKTIFQSYSKCKFIDDLNELLVYFLTLNTNNLSELNIKIIEFLNKKLKIKAEIFYSSSFKINEKRTAKLVKILELIDATEYISPVGAKFYLEEDGFRELTKVKLVFNDFIGAKYQQINQINFKKNLSIIDVIANLGWINTENYIKL